MKQLQIADGYERSQKVIEAGKFCFQKLCYLRKISECLREFVTISNNEVIMAWLTKTNTMVYIFKMMIMNE